MNNPYVTHLTATIANGIEIVDPIDFPEADWITFSEFYDSLNVMDEDDQIFCAVDQDQAEQLQEEYGIR